MEGKGQTGGWVSQKGKKFKKEEEDKQGRCQIMEEEGRRKKRWKMSNNGRKGKKEEKRNILDEGRKRKNEEKMEHVK